MSLKELTHENHRRAERSRFAHILMSGNITPELYYKYLTNQFYMYVSLEQGLRKLDWHESLNSVFRAEKMREDLQELEEQHGFVYDPALLTESTIDYLTYVNLLADQEDLNSLVSHMYVRHFGDMYGGAMIAKKVPGSGKMYEFDNKDQLKTYLRALLDDNMADEANVCFSYAIRLFEELGNDNRLGLSNKS
jgi:heme oxygenase